MLHNERLTEVRCPGCFGKMQLCLTNIPTDPDKPCMAYLACQCGWEAPTVWGETKEAVIEKALQVAARRDTAVLVKRWGEKEENGREDS